MTRVRLKKSPRFDKKFRVTFENGKIVDFGARGYSDYTIHKNPIRMRSYVTRHGGYVPHMVQKQNDPKQRGGIRRNRLIRKIQLREGGRPKKNR